MPDALYRSNAGVVDVLFAVALGEGFVSGLQEFKGPLVSGEVFALGAASQGVCRVLLGFLIIILSWLHYRRSTLSYERYHAAEFTADIIVIVAYMTLFLFVDTPTAYYTTIALIWLIYVIARANLWIRSVPYLLFGLAFIGFFALAAATTAVFAGYGAEWTRLLLVTAAIIAYRPLDRGFMRRIEATRFETAS